MTLSNNYCLVCYNYFMIVLWLFKRGMLSFLASISFLYTLYHPPSDYHINFGTCVKIKS